MTFEETKQKFETLVKELDPTADTSPGTVFSELLIKLATSVSSDVLTDVSTVTGTNNVTDVLASTEDTYSDTIDKVASNFNTTRILGSYSSGLVKVVVSEDRNYILSGGFTFTQPSLGTTYQTADVLEIISGATDAQIASGILPLLENDISGTYYFLVPVTATVVGPESQITDRTALVVDTNSNLSNFVEAYAYGDFSTGVSKETDKELIARFKEGLSFSVPVTNTSIKSHIQASGYPVQAISCVGAREIENTRSKHNALAIATLGVADVYTRTSVGVSSLILTKTCTKISTDTWSAEITRDEAPGFYQISGIAPTETNAVGVLPIVSTTFGYSVDPLTENDIQTSDEARFTRYQTCTVVFTYSDAENANVGQTRSFYITVSYMPFIKEIQESLISAENRVVCADYLVKAVIPCFVSVNLTVYKNKASDVIDSAAMKQDIYNYINTIPFGENVYASRLIDICHNYGVKRVDLPIRMVGQLYLPNGEVTEITDTDELAIPYLPSSGVSSKTSMFVATYYKLTPGASDVIDNISVTVI